MAEALPPSKSFQDEYEAVRMLHDGPDFVAREWIVDHMIPMTIGIVVGVSTLFWLTLRISKRLFPKAEKDGLVQASFRIVHMLVNLVFGILGSYLHSRYITNNPSLSFVPQSSKFSTNIVDKMIGHENLIVMSCGQLGYSLWSLVAGLMLVDEGIMMVGHHIAVICISTHTAVSHIGFRYYTPFMYGIMEFSTVPLTVMNTIKDFPTIAQRYSGLYTFVRLLFCGLFLYIRIYLLLPRQYEYLKLHAYAILSSENLLFQVIHGFNWLASLMLTGMQIFWATLIVRGLGKFFVRILFPNFFKNSSNQKKVVRVIGLPQGQSSPISSS